MLETILALRYQRHDGAEEASDQWNPRNSRVRIGQDEHDPDDNQQSGDLTHPPDPRPTRTAYATAADA